MNVKNITYKTLVLFTITPSVVILPLSLHIHHLLKHDLSLFTNYISQNLYTMSCGSREKLLFFTKSRSIINYFAVEEHKTVFAS